MSGVTGEEEEEESGLCLLERVCASART